MRGNSGMSLRPYQEAAIAAAIKPNVDIWRRLLVLATGAGKTVCAAEIINRALRPGRRALFLAHRDELITQAKAEIEGFVSDLHVEIEQADNRATRTKKLKKRRHVVVGSVQTLQRNRLQSWPQDAFDLIIIDEAHHSSANSYQSIVEHFGCLDDARRTPLIGVTATPMRSDNVGLDVLFQEISASYNIRDLIEQGYLCDIRALSVRTETDLRSIKVTAGDYNARELEDAADNDERNALILAAHRKYAMDRPTIVFATGVAHAKHLADLFNASGVPAEAMYGAMEDDARRDALERYRTGKTRVLTNCALLSEGFNAPQTSCIILGRPTKSSVIITQAIGRGTRLYPGKSDCLIIDVRDVVSGKNLFTAASLAGLPAEFQLAGKDMFKTAKAYAELEKLSPVLARQSVTAEAVEKNLQLATELMRTREIDLLQRKQRAEAKAPQLPVYRSPFMWYPAGGIVGRYEVSPDAGETTYSIWRTCEDNVWCAAVSVKYGDIEILGEYPDAATALHATDQRIIATHENTIIIERNAAWTRAPASPKQLAALAQYGPLPQHGLTKGEAALRLNTLFAQDRNKYAA
jgi:superfamily II DNA or RNA helicase